jgi:hypothetical protein
LVDSSGAKTYIPPEIPFAYGVVAVTRITPIG